jgi:hypothetical protein
MAKAPITESHSKVLSGILNVDGMTMEFDEIGVKPLKELLEKFDGENVKITISLKNEVSE